MVPDTLEEVARQRMRMLSRAEVSDTGAGVDECAVRIADGSVQICDIHGRSVFEAAVEVDPACALLIEEAPDVARLGVEMRERAGEALDDIPWSL